MRRAKTKRSSVKRPKQPRILSIEAFTPEVDRHCEYATSILMRMPHEIGMFGLGFNSDGKLALTWTTPERAGKILRSLGVSDEWIADLRPPDPTWLPIVVSVPLPNRMSALACVFVPGHVSAGGVA
jgi:hypothetical protein